MPAFAPPPAFNDLTAGAYRNRSTGSRPTTFRGGVDPGDLAVDGDFWMRTAAARPVVIDTDYWTDPGDPLAFRVALAFERAGVIDIQAVVQNVTQSIGPGAIDAQLTDEGRPGVPIGKPLTTHTVSGSPTFQEALFNENPHTEGFLSTVEDAVTVYRRTLAAADDGSVEVISIGFLNNLHDLLLSAADDESNLTGLELVTQKVKHLWVMGGEWPTGTAEYNFRFTTQAKEAANYVVGNWPSPITFLGYTVSDHLKHGGSLRFRYPTDLLTELMVDSATQYGRLAWDGLLVWMACIEDLDVAGFTATQGTGSVNASTGVCSWTDGANGPHRYVTKVNRNYWYETRLEDVTLPGAVASKTGLHVRVGDAWEAVEESDRVLGSRAPARSRATASNTDGLIMHLHAGDLADLSDTNTVSHWPCRMRSLPVRQATLANRPAFYDSVGSRPAVLFGSNQVLVSDPVLQPRGLTMYALVYFTGSLPGGAMAVVSGDDTGFPAYGPVLRCIAGSKSQGQSCTSTTVKTADGPAGLLLGTWQVILMRVNETFATVEAFVAPNGGSSVAITGEPNQVYAPFCIGNRYSDSVGSEQLVGYVGEVRIYSLFHSNLQRTNVATEMLA